MGKKEFIREMYLYKKAKKDISFVENIANNVLHIDQETKKRGRRVSTPLNLALFIFLILFSTSGIILTILSIQPSQTTVKEKIIINNTDHIVPIVYKQNITNNITIKESPGIDDGVINQMNRIINKGVIYGSNKNK